MPSRCRVDSSSSSETVTDRVEGGQKEMVSGRAQQPSADIITEAACETHAVMSSEVLVAELLMVGLSIAELAFRQLLDSC
jgi:hypothetical protein